MGEEIDLPVIRQIPPIKDNQPNAPTYRLMVQKPRQLDNTYVNHFIATYGKRLRQLIFSIICDDTIEDDTRKILAQDESFQHILHGTKNEFDQRYKLFDLSGEFAESKALGHA